MKTTSNRFALAAAFGLICLAPSVQAQSPATGLADLPSVKVSYADLNVGSEAGMRTLTSRVNNAVNHVCGHRFDSIRLREAEQIMDCRRQSRRLAWQQFSQNQERAQARSNTENAAIANRPEAR